ncbi:MAG: alanine racemase [Deltaproteobacteria bacterium]|nr:alanine racemase [Deltaproteobacteria bacterium]
MFPATQPPASALRPTRAEVSLEALGYNLSTIRGLLNGQKIYAVVKADAYGHGAVPVARHLAQNGVDAFAVALVEEGVELRESGIEHEILVLNGAYARTHREILQYRLTPVVSDLSDLAVFQKLSRGRPIGIHLKVDTGMSRLGLPFCSLPDFLHELERCDAIRMNGLMTHLARADDDPETTAEQLRLFEHALRLVSERGHQPLTIHAANSPGTIRHPEAHYSAVRVGLALYGLKPAPTEVPLRPIMRWRSEIISLRLLAEDTGVGYCHSFKTSRQTRLATLPIGYGDGLMRALSNRGFVLVRGRRCPIIGNISMDLTTVDVTDVKGCQLGDEAVIFGEQEGQSLSVDEVASWAGTINYEIVTSISKRVPRFYLEKWEAHG